MSYGFDSLGRFSTLVATNSGVQVANLQYTYMPGSDLLSGWTNSVPGTSISRSYESNRDLLTQVRNMGGQTTISEFNYSNDALGRRTARIDSGAAFTGMVTNDFGYNTRNELTSAQLGTSQYGYAFDPIGNRTASTNAGESFAYEANQLNQYTQIVDGGTNAVFHDPDGNLTNDGHRVFSWDAENRLLCVEPLSPTSGARRVRSSYDYMSRRVEKAVDHWTGSAWVSDSTNKFVWDGWLVVAEINQLTGGSASTNLTVWGLDLSGSLQGAGGIGGLICRTTADAGTHYYSMDGNGNVSDVVDGTGTNVLAHYEPGPFGEPRLVSGTLTTNPWQFSSKYWDAETGLGYWVYRYYDPILGRWLSRDPTGERGGLNVYAALRSSPTIFVDHLGLMSLLPWPRPDQLYTPPDVRQGPMRGIRYDYFPETWGDFDIFQMFLWRLYNPNHVGGIVHLSQSAVLRILGRGRYPALRDLLRTQLQTRCLLRPNGRSEGPVSDSGIMEYREAWYLGGHSYTMEMTADCCLRQYQMKFTVNDRWDFDFWDRLGDQDFINVIGTVGSRLVGMMLSTLQLQDWTDETPFQVTGEASAQGAL